MRAPARCLSGGGPRLPDGVRDRGRVRRRRGRRPGGFVKAWYAFRAGSPFRPWLLAIVANEARNRRRSGRRRDDLALRVAEDRPSGDAAPSPEAAALAGERRKLLLDAVGRLGENDRQVIACRYFLELSEAEMAAALGCRPGTVVAAVAGLDRLRAAMAEPGRWRPPPTPGREVTDEPPRKARPGTGAGRPGRRPRVPPTPTWPPRSRPGWTRPRRRRPRRPTRRPGPGGGWPAWPGGGGWPRPGWPWSCWPRPC